MTLKTSGRQLRRLAACAGILVVLSASGEAQRRAQPRPAEPLFGLQPFPYDFTLEAMNKVQELAASDSTIAVVHRDNGIPWAEALADRPFPAAVEEEWSDLVRRLPAGLPVYLALGPVAEDRVSIITPSKGSSMPRSIRNAPFDAPDVKKAYLNYARRAVARFRPQYLNLGVEAGEMAARAPNKWPAFVALYNEVRSQLKREHPELQIGISFGLQSLMDPAVAARSKALVENSDYLGLSFYPYMSPFHEKFGAPPLSPPPGEWRDALAWAARYTNKPIAICETGYSTRDVNLPAFKLRLKGSASLQEQYVRELGEIARRDQYRFVVWSIPVDYEALYKKLPPGDGRYQLWQNIGLFDSELRPRPAWAAWRALAGGQPNRPRTDSERVAAQAPPPASRGRADGLGFDDAGDLFVAPSPDRVELDRAGGPGGSPAMKWAFSYQKGRWQWLVKELRRGELEGRNTIRFAARSDRPGPLFIQLEEQGGETFFLFLEVGPEWQRVERPVSAFGPDAQKRKDGRLDMSQVVKILVADAAGALSGGRGARTIWFSDWSFD